MINYMLLSAEYTYSAKSGWHVLRLGDQSSEYIHLVDQSLKMKSDDPDTYLTRFGIFKNKLAQSDLVVYTAGTGFAHVYDDYRAPS